MAGKAGLATGENASFVTDTWEYNDVTDLWVKKSAFEGSSRTGAVAFSLYDRGFVLTGRNRNLSYDNMYEFFPNAVLDTSD